LSTSGKIGALVLAGTRPGGDPMAQHAGVSHKALIEVGGLPMLGRVLAALDGVPEVSHVVVAIDRPELLSAMPAIGKPVSTMPTASGPSATVAAALDTQELPLLVTTADHALLRAEWVTEFLDAAAHARAGDGSPADAVLALARRESVLAAVPYTQRTWLRFADGEFSGCNLFLLRSSRAAGIVRFWQDMEAQRKRPLSMLKRLGPGHVLRYRLGWLTLVSALQRLGELAGARLSAVTLSDGRAAIDVDKPADLDLVRELVRRQHN
jgi:GTP:adenosylcobinamide-phosphate guanylyltransferase